MKITDKTVFGKFMLKNKKNFKLTKNLQRNNNEKNKIFETKLDDTNTNMISCGSELDCINNKISFFEIKLLNYANMLKFSPRNEITLYKFNITFLFLFLILLQQLTKSFVHFSF